MCIMLHGATEDLLLEKCLNLTLRQSIPTEITYFANLLINKNIMDKLCTFNRNYWTRGWTEYLSRHS